jgi:hypothetical protein
VELLWSTFLRISYRIYLSLHSIHIPTDLFAFCIEIHGRSHSLSGVVVGNNIMSVAVRLLYKTASLPITHSTQAACSGA